MKKMKRQKVIDILVKDEMDVIFGEPEEAEIFVRNEFGRYSNEELKTEYEEFYEEEIKVVGEK